MWADWRIELDEPWRFSFNMVGAPACHFIEEGFLAVDGNHLTWGPPLLRGVIYVEKRGHPLRLSNVTEHKCHAKGHSNNLLHLHFNSL